MTGVYIAVVVDPQHASLIAFLAMASLFAILSAIYPNALNGFGDLPTYPPQPPVSMQPMQAPPIGTLGSQSGGFIPGTVNGNVPGGASQSGSLPQVGINVQPGQQLVSGTMPTPNNGEQAERPQYFTEPVMFEPTAEANGIAPANLNPSAYPPEIPGNPIQYVRPPLSSSMFVPVSQGDISIASEPIVTAMPMPMPANEPYPPLSTSSSPSQQHVTMPVPPPPYSR